MVASKGLPKLGLLFGGMILSMAVVIGLLRTQQGLSSEALDDKSTLLDLGDEETETCLIDRRTAFEQIAGPVFVSQSPTEHLEVPKLSSANSTAWEQWEFDGTSDTAESGVLINLTRDPSYHFFRQGNLRVELFLLLDGRTVLQELDFVDESIVATCPQSVVGIWSAPGRTYRFDVPKNMQGATVQWDTPRSKGMLTIESSTPPILARGPIWPNPESSARLSSSFSSAQPIAGGRLNVQHRAKSQNTHFSGNGGHTRVWAPDGWFTFAGGFNQIRAAAGPYALTYWQHHSRDLLSIDQTIYSAQLFKDGELVMSTTKGGGTSRGDGDRVSLTAERSGNVTGSGAPDVTGRTIEFVSGQFNKVWRFEIRHKHRQFDMSFGGGKGLSGFTAFVVGGEVGEESQQGSGFIEHTAFPIEFKQWQIYAVYAMHLVGTWWKKVGDLLP